MKNLVWGSKQGSFNSKTIKETYNMDAEFKRLLPLPIRKYLDSAAVIISQISPELWDEAIGYLIIKLKTKQAIRRGHPLFAEKFVCDVKTHIREMSKGSRYIIRRNQIYAD
ncbi:MAG: hypothetical protein KIT33_15620 [Candidatus Kapabacteria bacterium]|nr:hypothetical protein [Ignavibacteriota bacterium]MCW5886399.1 hypothetical protein [Candidatus Kapabacteria bacterium]